MEIKLGIWFANYLCLILSGIQLFKPISRPDQPQGIHQSFSVCFRGRFGELSSSVVWVRGGNRWRRYSTPWSHHHHQCPASSYLSSSLIIYIMIILGFYLHCRSLTHPFLRTMLFLPLYCFVLPWHQFLRTVLFETCFHLLCCHLPPECSQVKPRPVRPSTVDAFICNTVPKNQAVHKTTLFTTQYRPLKPKDISQNASTLSRALQCGHHLQHSAQ